METVQTRPIAWLWFPYLALGKLCILDGDPGVGKTLFATQLAANVSRGYPMPDQHGLPTLSCGDPGIVIFIATEDDLEDTVKPRLEQAGADCTKVKAFNEWQDGAGKLHTFTLADLPHLETVLKTYRPRLVYIDAIQSVLGAKVDANCANQLKALLDPLAKLAATYRCAMLASRHPAKPGQNNVKLIYRGANSMAILGTARLGLFAEDHPTDKTKALLLQSKSNAGAIGRTQVFSKAGGQFEWAGVSRITK
jgi:DNA repair protein RadA/Sms